MQKKLIKTYSPIHYILYTGTNAIIYIINREEKHRPSELNPYAEKS